jgi:predicted small integral membrane protein
MDVLDRPDGHFLYHHFRVMITGMLVWELVSPTIERRGFLRIPTTRERGFSSACWVPPIFIWPGSDSRI